MRPTHLLATIAMVELLEMRPLVAPSPAGLPYMLAQVLTTGLLIVLSYFASRRWIFLR
jgi:putative flippase GtrA